jgi:hypothetical protein
MSETCTCTQMTKEQERRYLYGELESPTGNYGDAMRALTDSVTDEMWLSCPVHGLGDGWQVQHRGEAGGES